MDVVRIKIIYGYDEMLKILFEHAEKEAEKRVQWLECDGFSSCIYNIEAEGVEEHSLEFRADFEFDR